MCRVQCFTLPFWKRIGNVKKSQQRVEKDEKEGEKKRGGEVCTFSRTCFSSFDDFPVSNPMFFICSHFVGMLLFNCHPVTVHVVKGGLAYKGKYLCKYYQSQWLLRGFVLTCESARMLFGPPFHRALFSCPSLIELFLDLVLAKALG